MLTGRKKPIVFGGPSLSEVPAGTRARLDVRPPVRCGDFNPLLEESHPGTVVIIDGVFNSSLAITPTECRHLLQRGWRLIGASSMGALRASDLWSVGMIGIGDVFTLYRLGVLRSDADVAVALNAETFEEATASVVHVRAVLSSLELRGEISGGAARRFLRMSRDIYWFERHWDDVIAVWARNGLPSTAADSARALMADPFHHPKKRDALLAINSVLAYRWVEPVTSAV